MLRQNFELHPPLPANGLDSVRCGGISYNLIMDTIAQLRQVIRMKDTIIEAQKEELRDCRMQLQAHKKRVLELRQVLREMEKAIKLQQTEEFIVPLRSTSESKQKISTATLHQQPSVLSSTQPESSFEGDKQLCIHLKEESISPAPCKMYKGSCTSYLDKAYFASAESNAIYMYDVSVQEWSALPDCPHKYSALSVINGLLTAVGGEEGPNKPTNVLISLQEGIQDSDGNTASDIPSQWLQHFPSMPTRRLFPSAVCHKSSLIVAGGDTTWISGHLRTIEVMHTETLQWFSACHLPMPVRGASAVVCEDVLYILGGRDSSGSSVLACSLSKLLLTCIKLQPSAFPYYDPTMWLNVSRVPVCQSTCVNMSGQLVVIGGQGARGCLTSTAYTYNRKNDLWEAVSHMSIGRYRCLAVPLLDGARVVVVGGLLKGGYATDVATVLKVTAFESTDKVPEDSTNNE